MNEYHNRASFYMLIPLIKTREKEREKKKDKIEIFIIFFLFEREKKNECTKRGNI